MGSSQQQTKFAVRDLDKLNSWEHISNTSFGRNSASVLEEFQLEFSQKNLTSEEIAWVTRNEFTSDEIEWMERNGTAHETEAEEIKDNMIPETHLNFVGVAEGIDMNSSFHRCEKSLKNDQDIAALEDKGKRLATEGISLGVADCNQKKNPGANARQCFQRHATTAVLTLRNFYDNKTPYPDHVQLYKISQLSGLTTKQINTWFSNERERERKRGRGTSSAGVSYKTRNNHPDAAINLLKAWVDTHPNFARPTKEEQIELANKADLSLKKVSYWFENYRKKERKLALKLQNDQLVGTKVLSGRLDTAEFEAQETRKNAEVMQQTGHELERLQAQISNDYIDHCDQEIWESVLENLRVCVQ